jgi:hypothetical protein
MSILKIQSVSTMKQAFDCGLVISGVENGQIQWLGDNVAWSNFNDGK